MHLSKIPLTAISTRDKNLLKTEYKAISHNIMNLSTIIIARHIQTLFMVESVLSGVCPFQTGHF